MRNLPAAVALSLALLLTPLGGALPVNLSVDVPSMDPYLGPLVVEVEAGSIEVKDGQLTVKGLDKEAIAPAGAVRIKVAWRFEQTTPLPAGYTRNAYAQAYVYEGYSVLGGQTIQRTYTDATWSESGVIVIDLKMPGVELRHELILRLYASYYSPYPYRSENANAVGSVVATGPPQLLTSRIQTGPRITAGSLVAVDVRGPQFQPGVTMQITLSASATVVTPDRFAILDIPVSFTRDTSQRGTGWEQFYYYAYAYDQDGRYLGSNGASSYRNYQCVSTPSGCVYDLLAVDYDGVLNLPVEFRWTSDVRHDITVYLYAQWYGYLCQPSIGCPWFSAYDNRYGPGGIVYTVPERAPSTDEVVRDVLNVL